MELETREHVLPGDGVTAAVSVDEVLLAALPRADSRFPLSLYLHVPFCEARCTYCDFNTFAGLDDLKPAYTHALADEVELAGRSVRNAATRVPVRTIFLGGGTPTALSLEQLSHLLGACRAAFDVAADAEITSEANPGTVDAEYLAGLRRLGVNRLSEGVQSLDDSLLAMLGRIHTAADVADTVRWARAAGFENLSLDLIYGLPLQTVAQWRETLLRTLDLQPDHLSCYALSVEEHTPLHAQVARGQLPPPDPDLAADMYDLAREVLAEAGLVHYEISNWGRTPCRHNLTYWRNEPWLGFGAGAHSWFGGYRFHDILNPRTFIAAVQAGRWPVAWHESIDSALEMAETAFLGLRLVEEGIGRRRFRARFERELDDVFGPQLRELKTLKLVEDTGDRVKLAPAALLVANQVFQRFLPEED